MRQRLLFVEISGGIFAVMFVAIATFRLLQGDPFLWHAPVGALFGAVSMLAGALRKL